MRCIQVLNYHKNSIQINVWRHEYIPAILRHRSDALVHFQGVHCVLVYSVYQTEIHNDHFNYKLSAATPDTQE